jgi:hypothetical protein
MSAPKPIKIKISGSGPETDAPSLDDLLLQVRDVLDVLQGVEEAIAGEGEGAITWRVTNASRSSPLQMELTPYAREFAVNVDHRAMLVVSATAAGLQAIESTSARPPFFSEQVLHKIERLASRTLNGLALTEIEFPGDLPTARVTSVTAKRISENVRGTLYPAERSYEEIGSVEGYYAGVERDGYGRRVLYLKHRITGDRIKCIVSERALRDISDHSVAMVFDRRRLLVSGRLHFKALGQLREVAATKVVLLRQKSDLPSLSDIQDVNFTGGLTSEEYLERLRDGGLS